MSTEADVAVLQEQMREIRQDVSEIKAGMIHLDQCVDQTKDRLETLLSVMLIFHDPMRWLKTNWSAVVLVLLAFGVLTSLPNAAVGKLLGLALRLVE